MRMARYIVTGGIPLNGHASISGNKNSILALLPATLLANSPVTLHNVPQIADVAAVVKILEIIGCRITGLGTSTLTIDPSRIRNVVIPPELTKKVRSSIMFLAPLLARFGKAELGFPGGDTIGKRAIGTHFDALASFDTKFKVAPNLVSADFSPAKKDVLVFLDETSVTATENSLMLAASLPVTTVIKNAASEPHVVDLGEMLIKMGAKVTGLGTNTITIIGVSTLQGTTHAVSFDYVDAGTLAIAAAVTGGTLTISPVNSADMHIILLYLSRFGIKYSWPKTDTLKIHPSQLSVDPEGLGIRQKFQTNIWPGFPTDLMSPLITLATQTTGTVLLHDWMYETRMYFTDKLIQMGANITLCDPHRVIVTGPTPLFGRHLPSPDIRAGMSLLIAALAALGQSEIDHVEIIERGHENPVGRLQALGAKITRVASEHEV